MSGMECRSGGLKNYFFFFFFCKRIRSMELKISALIYKGFMNLKFEPDLGCRAEHSLYF